MPLELYVGLEMECLFPGHGVCTAEVFQYNHDIAYCIVLDGECSVLGFSLATGENLDGLLNCRLLLPKLISN